LLCPGIIEGHTWSTNRFISGDNDVTEAPLIWTFQDYLALDFNCFLRLGRLGGAKNQYQ